MLLSAEQPSQTILHAKRELVDESVCLEGQVQVGLHGARFTCEQRCTVRVEHEISEFLLNAHTALFKGLCHLFVWQIECILKLHQIVNCCLIEFAVFQHIPKKSERGEYLY